MTRGHSGRPVALLTGIFPPVTGGELYCYRLYRYLEEAGYEVRHIDPTRIENEGRVLAGRVLRRFAWTTAIGRFCSKLAGFALLVRATRGTLLVEDHGYNGGLAGINLLHRALGGGKIVSLVFHFEGYDSEAPASLQKTWNAWRNRARLTGVGWLVTISDYSLREILSLGVNPKKVSVLAPGLDREKLALLPQATTPSREPIVLCVGHCIERKNILVLVEAFAQSAGPDWQLELVGSTTIDPAYFERVRRRCQELGVAQRVHFRGRLGQDDLNTLYARSSIFAFTSTKEGFGIALLEAMYFGLPIVAGATTAIPELVRDGENGLLAPVDDARALACALGRLMDDPALRERLGENGRGWLAGRFEWDDTCRAIVQGLEMLD